MSKWIQVAGDVNWSGTGCTLARDNRSARQVDLVRITPWLELDSSALQEGYGLWDVSTDTVDYEDMSVENAEVRGAIKSADMTVLDYKKGRAVDRANLICEYRGFQDDSRSVSKIADALPKPLEQIELWRGGKISASDLPGIDQEMRREATYKLYGGRSSRHLPKYEALAFALGEDFAAGTDPLVVELDDDETQALRLANAVAGQTGFWEPPSEKDKKITVQNVPELVELLGRLTRTPDHRLENLPETAAKELRRCYLRDFDFDDLVEDVDEQIDQDAENARGLARKILEDLGF
jgi:hypothetical protein